MYSTITREELKNKMENDEKFHLVEVLSKKEFDRKHIIGAEHIQFGEIASIANARFAKDDEIVVYCADEECSASPTAAEKLDAVGYTNVYDFEGGKEAWREAGFPMTATE